MIYLGSNGTWTSGLFKAPWVVIMWHRFAMSLLWNIYFYLSRGANSQILEKSSLRRSWIFPGNEQANSESKESCCKPGSLSSIPRTQMVEGGVNSSKWSSNPHMVTRAHAHLHLHPTERGYNCFITMSMFFLSGIFFVRLGNLARLD